MSGLEKLTGCLKETYTFDCYLTTDGLYFLTETDKVG